MYVTPENSVDAIQRIASVPTILDVVCQTTGMGFAAIARVTEDRWIACGVRDEIAFGLQPGGELKIETTICHEIRRHREPVVIDNVSLDPLYASHHTPALYGLQSYISMPITLADGTFFGTLCAIDVVPRSLNTPKTLGMFKLFADLIAFHLDAQTQLESSQNLLATEKHDTGLREQFIAVLGHDLRNPLASIDAGTRVLQRAVLDDKSKTVVALIQGSVKRMAGIIDNVLDFARGRMGDGVPIEKLPDVALKPVLEQIVDEMRAAHPDRAIQTDLSDGVATCDPIRIGQLFSNLLSNAVTHGAPESPIYVTGSFAMGKSGTPEFRLEVANSGEAIPEAVLDTLFKPFVRSSARANQQGLGLGLYIASEIAKAHEGTLSASSTASGTRFMFRMGVSTPLR
ncbi:GAF domain-containing sensor histidine kinase [Pararhizobium sp.]|uniref:GAF domain-containing sensor histidine kinase n=1 Tax=Pararhizobium sp. TaxID=1977563 RepID=UPI00272290C8|nr:GAF domain-containing sensor histidine kinase [Pararhizobium sp.]MDO9417164.1 GAF domain-containing sensor histidine kinase [Pararhizobium sp.]